MKNETELLQLIESSILKPPYIVVDHKNFLTDDLINIIESIAKIKHIVVFSDPMFITTSNPNMRIIHSDVEYVNDTMSWKDIYCGLNFELNPSTNIFQWYDTSNSLKLPPNIPQNEIMSKLSGCHYGERMKHGIRDFKKLDETIVDNNTITLVRTDTPHLTIYDSVSRRCGISVRIDESNISSWDQVLELFKPLYN